MKRRIIIILVSIILLLLSFLSINSKIISPIIKNKKIKEWQEQQVEEFNKVIEENPKKNEEEKKESESTEDVSIELPKNEEEICRTIIGSYFHYINSDKFEEAYKMLDDKFKNNYFPTYEQFEQYCVEKYTAYKVLEYVKYERRNDFILVKIIVKDIRNQENSEEMQINIAEKGNYTYTISFGIEG